MRPRRRRSGFTLVELLVVMAIIATLLSLVGPRYFQSIDKAKESTLKSNLRIVRDAIDKHFADTGKYPEKLESLVTGRYLREVPQDPIAERSDTWVLVAHPNRLPGIYDVRSAASGKAIDGTEYSTW